MENVQEALRAALRAQRRHVVGVLDGLDDDALTGSAVPSGWSPLGMVRHLTFDVERFWFEGVVLGRPLDLPTDDDVWHPDPWPSRQHVLEEYEIAAARSDEVLASVALDARPPAASFDAWPGIPDRDLFATTLHVIAETAAHAGHLDIARELVDGHQRLVLTEFRADRAEG